MLPESLDGNQQEAGVRFGPLGNTLGNALGNTLGNHDVEKYRT